jgi:hypothetical protein
MSSSSIRCADCAHCKQFREVDYATGRYILKVKCTKGHWKRGRKRGAVDLYRVMARRMQKCMDYDSMSDNEQDRTRYLRDLAASLPLERIVYEGDGEPADIFDVHGIDTNKE